ncbi:multiple sugar transport system substrate-binding protein [Paenibacillus sp. V4I5]|nr:multiple sugar transport system substrate-binding protein [Paenibacillus sp. V4I5]
MMTKRTHGGPKAVLALIASVGLLAGCSSANQTGTTGSTNTPGTKEPASSTAKASGTVTFWYDKTGVAGEAIKAAADAFQAAHPEIKLNAVYVADLTVGGGQKLMSAVAGGTAPDAVFFDRFQIASWAQQEALIDISERVKKDTIDPKKFYPAAWNEVVYKDKVYGLPVSTDGRALFYNKDHFKEVGLDPEKPPKTIKELEEYAAKLTVKEGNIYKRIGLIPWSNQGNFYTWGWAFGGDFYNTSTGKVTPNDPKNVEALQWLQDYANKYNISDMKSLASSTQINPFAAGKVSMEIGNNLLAATVKAANTNVNFGVAQLPTPTGDQTVTWSGGFSLVIPKGAKNQDGAWELLKFFTGDEAQEKLTKSYLSVVHSVNQKVFANDPINTKILGFLGTAHWRPVISQGQLLWNEMASALDMASNNKGKPKELLDSVADKVNAALASDQKSK